MKKLILISTLLYSSISFATCASLEVAKKYSCNVIQNISIDQWNKADKWCSDTHGQGFFAYETTVSCPKTLNEETIDQTERQAIVESRFEFNSTWDNEYKKTFTIQCHGHFKSTCVQVCSDENICVLPEGVCKNCIGTNIELTNFFRNVGKTFLPIESSQAIYNMEVLLESNNFVTFDSKSIFNLMTRYDSKGMKNSFKSLCSDGTEYPVVIANVYPKTRGIQEFSLVLCNTGVFELTAGNQLSPALNTVY